MRRLFAPALLALLGLHCLVPLRAGAETGEVSLAGQYGLPYLPFMVMEHEKLIEKRARALGIASLNVKWITVGGPAAGVDRKSTRLNSSH